MNDKDDLVGPRVCPAHSTDGVARAVATNRQVLGLPPQPCTCDQDAAEEEWWARAPEDRAKEIAMMDEHVAEQDGL